MCMLHTTPRLLGPVAQHFTVVHIMNFVAVANHRLPLEEAADGYHVFNEKTDNCIKVGCMCQGALQPWSSLPGNGSQQGRAGLWLHDATAYVEQQCYGCMWWPSNLRRMQLLNEQLAFVFRCSRC